MGLIFNHLFRRLVSNSKDLNSIDEVFVKQFILNGSVIAPTETLLIQTDSLAKLTEKIKSNKTFCFNTDPGKFGWCATCKVIIIFTQSC